MVKNKLLNAKPIPFLCTYIFNSSFKSCNENSALPFSFCHFLKNGENFYKIKHIVNMNYINNKLEEVIINLVDEFVSVV